MKLELPTFGLISEALEAATNATIKIVFLVIVGVIATANGVFNDQGVSDLGRLIYHVTLPSLLFVNIIREVSVEKLLVLWKLPAMALLHVSTGFILAKLLNRVFQLRGIEAKAVILAMMFGNVGALAIAIIDTLCSDEPLRSGVGPICDARGVEYISFYLITQNILMFTWAEKIVRTHEDEEEYENVKEVGQLEGQKESQALLAEGDGAEKGQQTAGAQQILADGGVRDGSIQPQRECGAVAPDLWIKSKSLFTGKSGSRLYQRQGSLMQPKHYTSAEHVLSQRGPARSMPMKDSPPARLERYYSQPSALDQLTISHILSRYPVESRPSIDADDVDDDDGQASRFIFLSPRPRAQSSDRDHLVGAVAGLETSKLKEELGPPPPSCFQRIYRSTRRLIRVLVRIANNPSIRAALAAFTLGLIPPIKTLFVGDKAPLGSFLAAIEILGNAQVPCSMLMMSGSGTIRYLNARAAKTGVGYFAFSARSITCIILGRVFIFPLLGLFWWVCGYEAGLFHHVPVLSLVMMLDAAVPTAQNIVMLILVHGKPEHGHALAYVLLWQYAICVPMLIVNVTTYLAIVQAAYLK